MTDHGMDDRGRGFGAGSGGTSSVATGKADARGRAARLVAQLEAEVAATADQRAVLVKAFDHPLVVEPHRDHHAYVLGADLFGCGLASGDAYAMMGLMSLGPTALARRLLEAAETRPNVYVARLWPVLIDADRAALEARGRFVGWQRRWARYKEEADSWAARGRDVEAGDDWRALHMTSGQRHLVQDCATMLGLPVPENLTRGTAHDWLRDNGANAVYRQEAR